LNISANATTLSRHWHTTFHNRSFRRRRIKTCSKRVERI